MLHTVLWNVVSIEKKILHTIHDDVANFFNAFFQMLCFFIYDVTTIVRMLYFRPYGGRLPPVRPSRSAPLIYTGFLQKSKSIRSKEQRRRGPRQWWISR